MNVCVTDSGSRLLAIFNFIHCTFFFLDENLTHEYDRYLSVHHFFFFLFCLSELPSIIDW